MPELTERLRKGWPVSDWDSRGIVCHMRDAEEAADHIETLEAALRTIQSAIPGYLKGEMSEHDFALLVLEAADSSIVNKTLEKVK